ncbi:hypothetical protein ACR9PT_07525 [Piscirickettsia salmonis]|uniref:hypothetical protein n=1 Tax=Piscirickettsia salmonis TaxID=1238 RepID=UPI003EBDDA5B
MLMIEKDECQLITEEFRDVTIEDIAEAINVGVKECKKKWKAYGQPYKTRNRLFEEHYKLGLRADYDRYVHARPECIKALREFITQKTTVINCRSITPIKPLITRKHSEKQLSGKRRL